MRLPKFKVGEFYQDCANHPVICTWTDGYDVNGISLIDGTWPRSCSIRNCGVLKIGLRKAIKLKTDAYSAMMLEQKKRKDT